MKILHILYSGLGGHGNVFFSMVDADQQHEFQYEAVFFGIENAREQYITKASERGIKWHFVKKQEGIDIKAYKKIIRIIKASNPDIVFLHSSAYIIPAKIACLFSKRRIIVRETQPNHLKSKFEWLGLLMAFFAANKIVFLSEEYKAELQAKLGLFMRRQKIHVIPNGIDLSLFKPSPAQRNGAIRIGMQSRLTETKDHATLLKAFAIVIKEDATARPVKLLIAGSGNCKSELVQLSKELGIAASVEFVGMLEEQALPAFINSLDIYVHASLGETMSTAIMQVMACRLPVIASNVKGINNMVTDKVTGLLVNAKNERQLADAIQKLIADAATANLLAENAYKKAAEKFSNLQMFKKYRALFLKQ